MGPSVMQRQFGLEHLFLVMVREASMNGPIVWIRLRILWVFSDGFASIIISIHTYITLVKKKMAVLAVREKKIGFVRTKP